MEVFSTWQFNLVAYLVSVVFFFQFNKIAVRQARDEAAATIILQSIATISILVLVPFFPITFPAKAGIYGLMLLACVFYAVNDRLQTPIRKHLQVSMFSIINQLVFVFIFLYALFIFHEEFDLSKTFGVLLIIGANVLLLYKRGEIQVSKYISMALIAAFALATAITIDVEASTAFNLPIYIALTLLIPAIFIMAAEKISIGRVVTERRQSQLKPYIIAGVAWAATIFFSLRALQLGEVTTVIPLQSLSVLLNVVVAYLFMKERQDIAKKIIATGLVMIGILLVV